MRWSAEEAITAAVVVLLIVGGFMTLWLAKGWI